VDLSIKRCEKQKVDVDNVTQYPCIFFLLLFYMQTWLNSNTSKTCFFPFCLVSFLVIKPPQCSVEYHACVHKRWCVEINKWCLYAHAHNTLLKHFFQRFIRNFVVLQHAMIRNQFAVLWMKNVYSVEKAKVEVLKWMT
jgi:hypothetical protein